MEKDNSTNKNLISIPINTNLNDHESFINEKFETTPALNTAVNLKGKELEMYVFESVLNSLGVINFAFLAAYGELTNIRKSLIEMINEHPDLKVIKVPKAYMPDEDDRIVIIIEYFKLKIEELGLGFICDQDINYFFNGKYWQVSGREVFKDFLSRVAERTGMPQTKSKQDKIKEKLLIQFETTFKYLGYSEDDEQIKINLKNGTFWFNNKNSEASEVGFLKETNREDFFKYQLSFQYDPEATAPKFKVFLNRVLPDVNAQDILMEYMGYIFSSLKLEKTLILYGHGSNGKSVFFEIVKALLGEDNLSYFPMDQLMDSTGYHRAKLNSKLLNYASELGTMKDIEMFKRMASGEPITARLPYGHPIEMTRYCKFMFNANTLPRVEQTEAFFRRQLIIPFTQIISESEKDIDLPNKIITTELSGIFNMILEGLRRLVKQGGFTKSKMIDDQLNLYRKESNNVELFLEEERYTKSTNGKILLSTLYQFYRLYCSENGYKALNKNNFSERLRKLNYTVKRSTGGSVYVWCEKAADEDFLKASDEKTIMEIFNIKR